MHVPNPKSPAQTKNKQREQRRQTIIKHYDTPLQDGDLALEESRSMVLIQSQQALIIQS